MLYKKSMSVEEIAERLGLQHITIRHHLQSLEEAGFIEPFAERARSVGRPKIFYKMVKGPPLVGYPKRQYMTLTDFLINTMQLLLGTDRAKKILKKAGIEMGENTIKRLESENNVREWTPRLFEQLFVKDYLDHAGSEPEIVEVSDQKIVYRLYNCPFFELAAKMPEAMCDALHESFHQGVTKAMGKSTKISRTTCMAEGDAYCEHVCEWLSR